MREHFGVANSDGERGFNLLAPLGVLVITVERPGVSVEGEDVVATRDFASGNFEGLRRIVSVVGVVEDQLVVRVVADIGFPQRVAIPA